MRVLLLIFLTLPLFSASLNASAEFPQWEEELHASRQRMTTLINEIEGMQLQKIDQLTIDNDRHIHLAGEFYSMKTAVVKMLDRARLTPNKRYVGNHDEPIRKSLRIMIMQSSLSEPDKQEHLSTWRHECYRMEQLIEYLNFYASAELEHLSRITPTHDMPKDDCELGMYLSHRYLSYGQEFTKRCATMAESMVFGGIRKSPRIASAYALLSQYDSDENISGTSSEEDDDHHDVNTSSSSSRDSEVSQSPNKYNYSEDYIRMNFREGEYPE